MTIRINSSLYVVMAGNSTDYGDSNNNGDVKVNSTASAYGKRGRWLAKFDLSQIPKFSKITSAKITFRIAAIRGDGYVLNPPPEYPLNFYRADIFEITSGITWQTYDGVHSWYGAGMKPDWDYPLEPVHVSDVLELKGSILHTVEIKEVIQSQMAKDNYDNFAVMWRLSDTDEADIISRGAGKYYHSLQPYIEIDYTYPITFYNSDDTGAIDYNQQLTESPVHALNTGSVRLNDVGAARKIWVKNEADIDFYNLYIYSPVARASRQYEIEYSTTYDNKDWDITTTDKSQDNVNYTQTSWYKIEFTDATNFTVYRSDKQVDASSNVDDWASIGTGTVGTQFQDTDRGVYFTLPSPTTNPTAGDTIIFRTYEGDAIINAPSDSDQCFEIAQDIGGTPGDWYVAEQTMGKITADGTGTTTISVSTVKNILPNNNIAIYERLTGNKQTAKVVSIDSVNNTLTVDTSVSVSTGDYFEVDYPSFVSSIFVKNQEIPVWIRGYGNTNQKEMKYGLIRAIVE